MRKIFLIILISAYTLIAHGNPSLKIASFNIQIFGQSKIKDSLEMKYIVDILRKFDVVAIQEIRSKSQDVLPVLVQMLGEEYWDYRISPRLGRSSSKEQYGFVFRKDYVEIDTCFMIADPMDLLHREPFVCSCKSENFDYYLANIHTDPDEVSEEINVMDDILEMLTAYESDVIILGDFNASPSDFDELCLVNDIGYAIDSEIMTNTRGTKNYDNLVFIKSNLIEYQYGGVFNFKDYYGISEEMALKISDHLPVFGVFDTAHDDD